LAFEINNETTPPRCDEVADLLDADGNSLDGLDGVGDVSATSTTSQQTSSGPSKDGTQTEQLTAIVRSLETFRANDGTAYVLVRVRNHFETYAVRSSDFRHWLTREYYQRYGRSPSSQSVAEAMGLAEAIGKFGEDEREVFYRVGSVGDRVYIDLGDTDWHVVEVDRSGWRVLNNSPVRFRRAKGMTALPMPVAGGCLVELRQFLNVDDDGWILLASWLLGCFRPQGPYPLLVLNGEQGTSKSTTAKILRSLVDPSSSPLRQSPTKNHDLMIAASNQWVVAYDNLSQIRSDLSDALCRLATGGGFSTRQLYADTDEVILDVMRPALLTGIEDLVGRDDLADRAITVTLSQIPDERRIPEHDLWTHIDEARPRILGALLDAVSTAICRWSSTKLAAYPRMADFTRWVVAAEPTLPWEEGEFQAAYGRIRDAVTARSIETNIVAAAVTELMKTVEVWKGTATELIEVLRPMVPDRAAATSAFPKLPTSLSNQLRRAAPALRRIGIDIDFKKSGSRMITIVSDRRPPAASSTPPTPSAVEGTVAYSDPFEADSEPNICCFCGTSLDDIPHLEPYCCDPCSAKHRAWMEAGYPPNWE